MPDPNNYAPMPGFPQVSSQHAVPPHLRDPHANALHPAISQAQAEQGGRTTVGPPLNGWPVGPAQPGTELVGIQQRTVDGLASLLQMALPNLPPMLQIGVGAMMSAIRQQVSKQTEEQTIHMLNWLELQVHSWRTGEPCLLEQVPQSDNGKPSESNASPTIVE